MFRLITLSTCEFLWCSDSDPFFHCLKVDPTAKSTGNRVWTIYDVIWCHWFNGLFFWIGPQDSGLPGHRMASSGLGSPARKLCKKNAEQKATWAKTHGTDEGLREHNRSPQKQRSNGSFDPFVWKRGTSKNLIDYSITFIFIHFHSFSTSKLLVWIPFRIGFLRRNHGIWCFTLWNPRRQARGELSRPTQ